jgi:hypothetical protein
VHPLFRVRELHLAQDFERAPPCRIGVELRPVQLQDLEDLLARP